MRRAAVLTLALLGGGCKVEVDGAPCGRPGLECPTGQACGNDGRCSARAAACADRCNPATAPLRCGLELNVVEECQDTDPVCGAWNVVDDCASDQLGCTNGACVCRQNTTSTLYTDPNPVGTRTGLTPTGVQQPPQCRFSSLHDALRLATAGMTVIATGTMPVTFSTESFPLEVPAGVTLQGDPSATAEQVIIDAPTTVPDAMVKLGDGAILERVTVKNVIAQPTPAPPAGSGVQLACGSAAAAAVRDVRVTTDTLQYGISVAGSCGANIWATTVSGPRRAALLVDSADGVLTEVVGSTLTATRPAGDTTSESIGVLVKGGDVNIRAPDGTTFDPLAAAFAGGTPTRILQCTGEGVHAEGRITGPPIHLTIDGAEIAWNGAAGIWISKLPDTSEARVQHSDIYSNGSSNYYGTRTAGGLVLAGMAAVAPAKLPLTFLGNVIRENAGDQIGLYVTGEIALDGGSCVVDPNVFSCLNESTYAVYATLNAAVTSTSTYWFTDPPVVTGNVDWSGFCTLAQGESLPACPPASPP